MFFACRPSMSGPHLLKKGKEHRKMDVHRDFTVASPAEFVTRFGGNRIIDKVRVMPLCVYCFTSFTTVKKGLIYLSHLRYWLLIMALLQLNACVQFDAGPMKCSVMRESFALWWWSHLKTWKPMQVNNQEKLLFNLKRNYICICIFYVI